MRQEGNAGGAGRQAGRQARQTGKLQKGRLHTACLSNIAIKAQPLILCKLPFSLLSPFFRSILVRQFSFISLRACCEVNNLLMVKEGEGRVAGAKQEAFS